MTLKEFSMNISILPSDSWDLWCSLLIGQWRQHHIQFSEHQWWGPWLLLVYGENKVVTNKSWEQLCCSRVNWDIHFRSIVLLLHFKFRSNHHSRPPSPDISKHHLSYLSTGRTCVLPIQYNKATACIPLVGFHSYRCVVRLWPEHRRFCRSAIFTEQWCCCAWTCSD